MYIVKNALKCISRSKGRNILIGIIVLVIAVSACLGLSIRQAADSAKKETLAGMSVTATISYDRQSAMQSIMGQGMPQGGFDRDQFASVMGEASGLTLEEYEKYAEAESVREFYYELSVSVNGTESFEPVSTETDSEEDVSDESEGTSEEDNGFSGGKGGFGGMMGGMGGFSMSDFTVTGYSGDEAMTDFQSGGSSSVEDGSVFDEGTENYDCIISIELAAYNDISVGDTVDISNPNDEEEIYTLTVVGIYTNTASDDSGFSMMGMGMTSQDPANQIYMSYNALAAITAASEENATVEVDEETGRETSTAMSGTLSGTYVFSDTEAFEQFENEVRELGLDDSYKVSSSDVEAYENSLAPLNTLSTMAGYFLLVILIIGAIILVVLNIFNVRERKYEIGVLTAMGMKKGKVAVQFMTEIFAVTLAAVVVGAVIGGVFSVPVTNALLANQVASQNSQLSQAEQNFGRQPGNMGEMPGNMGGGVPELPDNTGDGGGKNNPFANIFGGSAETNYVTEVSSAMNITVVLQMLGIAVLLTLAAGAVAILFVMRYEPLKILSDRD